MNPHTRPPADPQDAPLYRRIDISPEQFFQTLGRARKAARDEIERLIDWLDSTIDVDQDAAVDDAPCDGDADAEPSLGSFDRMSDQIKAWAHRGWAEVDMEFDRAELEPALAAPENHPGSQERWASGSSDDREGDPGTDDREPDEEVDGGRYLSLMEVQS